MTAAAAFLFPGQGSQKVGMGRALFEGHAAARAVYEEADDALGFPLSKLCFEGPQSDLTLTQNGQPAILTTSIAALRVIEAETDIRPTIAAGHSLGEYSALVAAGSLSFSDTVTVVHQRGRFMQEAVPAGEGGMAAVLGLDVDAIADCCNTAAAELSLVVAPANLNGGGQVVIAGATAAVTRVCELCKEKGAKRAIPLKVSAPFHCQLMQPAADKLAAILADIKVGPLAFPVVTNVEAKPNQDANRVRDLLTRQVTAPVYWEDTIRVIAGTGVDRAIEVGHGNVLAGLVKRIASELPVVAAGDMDAVMNLSQT